MTHELYMNKIFIGIFVKFCINIDKNNYLEDKELDTNPSITLAQTLTLSTCQRSFGHFTSSRCNNTTIFNFA